MCYYGFVQSSRVIVWFSCGAASAVTLQQALLKFGRDRVVAVYCDTSADEHPDNWRFRADVERWLGVRVQVISSKDFSDCDSVFERTRYVSGPYGARCTTELKKIPRFKFQAPDDIHCFGFTNDKKEMKRIRDFEKTNFDLNLSWVLPEAGINKAMCFQILTDAGIALPSMYRLGYRNNNCIGCVKSSSPGYWQKILLDFPDRFQLRAERTRKLGVRLVEFTNIKNLPTWAVVDSVKSGKKTRIFLDVLAALVKEGHSFPYKGENLSCGPECAEVIL